MFKIVLFILAGCFFYGATQVPQNGDILNALAALAPKESSLNITEKNVVPCICGVFLSGQLDKSKKPKENAIFMHEYDEHLMCNQIGSKQCVNKCLDVLVKHLANSPALICGALGRDCTKERAYLFIKNCKPRWVNSNLSAGREFCCKNGEPYACPFM